MVIVKEEKVMRLMNVIFHRFFWVIISFCVLSLTVLGGVSFAESEGIKITEPLDGSTVIPGQEIIVTIESVGGFEFESGLLGIPRFFQEELTALPATFTVTIPNEVAGKILIHTIGKNTSGQFVGDEITLTVQQTATLQSLKVDPDDWVFETDWNGNVEDEYIYIDVEGVYSDGITRDITDAGTTYVSSDPSVVSVDSEGKMRPHKLGEATITVSNSGVTATIPVTVRKPRGIPPEETIPPTTQIDIHPTSNEAGWHNSNITVTLTATDNEGGSGVKEIGYQLLGMSPGMRLLEQEAVQGNRAEILISKEGISRLGYCAVDNERNKEAPHFVEFKLDKTPPQTTASVFPSPNEYGWSNTLPVNISFEATDNLSGIATKPDSISLDKEGIYNIDYWSKDIADNVEKTKTLTARIDTTAPQTTYSLSETPNNYGWINKLPLNITFSATDPKLSDGNPGSGVCFITEDKTINQEGIQTIDYSSSDFAGNKEVPKSLTVNIDITPPEVSLGLEPVEIKPHLARKNKLLLPYFYKLSYQAEDALSGLKQIKAGLIIPDIDNYRIRLRKSKRLDIIINQRRKHLIIIAPEPKAVLSQLKQGLLLINNHQTLHLNLRPKASIWTITKTGRFLAITAPSIAFKAEATDFADNISTQELQYQRPKRIPLPEYIKPLISRRKLSLEELEELIEDTIIPPNTLKAILKNYRLKQDIIEKILDSQELNQDTIEQLLKTQKLNKRLLERIRLR